jgi:Leucine Rich repeat
VTVKEDSFDRFFSSDENRHVRSLRMHNVSFESSSDNNDGVAHLQQADKTAVKRTPDLVEVSMDLCQLDEQAVRVLGPVLKDMLRNHNAADSLQRIQISNSEISTTFVEWLVEILEREQCTLEQVELDNVQLEDASRADLLLAFQHCPKLQLLRLEKCGLERNHAHFLAELVRTRQSLTTLDVSKNNLDGTALQTLLEKAISNHPALKTLVLRENPIGDEGAIALSQFLAQGGICKLQSLSITDCEIWDDGCRALAQQMSKFVTLKELILGAGWEDHMDVLAQSLRHNMVLTSLWMPAPIAGECNDETMSVWRQIQCVLYLNRSKRQVLLSAPIFSFKWLDALTMRGEAEADVVFHLLRERPQVVAHGQHDDNLGTWVCG